MAATFLSLTSSTPKKRSSQLHIAIVSFGYPPIPHVCGTRASEMGAALVALGFRVTVITVDWRLEVDRPRRTSERGVDVVRVDPRDWHAAFDPRKVPFTTEAPFANMIARRVHTLCAILSWGPYEQWARRALQELQAIHAVQPVDVVWAIHGDDSSHEVAARFHRGTGVPWVADFKDPWNAFHRKPVWPLQWMGTSRRLRTSSAITETCRAQAAVDAARFGRSTQLIWSGYDAEMMERAAPMRTSDRFSVVYLGTLCQWHDVGAVVQLLELWRHDSCSPLEIHVYGHGAQDLESRLRARRITSAVMLHSFVNREQAFRIMKGADALLLLPATHLVRSGGPIGVKELEYLASGTPVLSLGKLTPEMDEVARDCPQVVQARDVQQAAEFLREEMAAWQSGTASPRRAAVNLPAVAAHAWPAKAEQLRSILLATVRGSKHLT